MAWADPPCQAAAAAFAKYGSGGRVRAFRCIFRRLDEHDVAGCALHRIAQPLVALAERIQLRVAPRKTMQEILTRSPCAAFAKEPAFSSNSLVEGKHG